jgi:hypothetical protein
MAGTGGDQMFLKKEMIKWLVRGPGRVHASLGLH